MDFFSAKLNSLARSTAHPLVNIVTMNVVMETDAVLSKSKYEPEAAIANKPEEKATIIIQAPIITILTSLSFKFANISLPAASADIAAQMMNSSPFLSRIFNVISFFRINDTEALSAMGRTANTTLNKTQTKKSTKMFSVSFLSLLLRKYVPPKNKAVKMMVVVVETVDDIYLLPDLVYSSIA